MFHPDNDGIVVHFHVIPAGCQNSKGGIAQSVGIPHTGNGDRIIFVFHGIQYIPIGVGVIGDIRHENRSTVKLGDDDIQTTNMIRIGMSPHHIVQGINSLFLQIKLYRGSFVVVSCINKHRLVTTDQ